MGFSERAYFSAKLANKSEQMFLFSASLWQAVHSVIRLLLSSRLVQDSAIGLI